MHTSKQVFIYQESSQDQNQAHQSQCLTQSLKSVFKKDINKLIFQQFTSSSDEQDKYNTQLCRNNTQRLPQIIHDTLQHQNTQQQTTIKKEHNFRLSNCLNKFDSQEYSKSLMRSDGFQQPDYDSMKVVYKQSKGKQPLTQQSFHKRSLTKVTTVSLQQSYASKMQGLMKKNNKSAKKHHPRANGNFFKQLNFETQNASKIKIDIKKLAQAQLGVQKEKKDSYQGEKKQSFQNELQQYQAIKSAKIDEQISGQTNIRLIDQRQEENPEEKCENIESQGQWETEMNRHQSSHGNILIPGQKIKYNQKILTKEISSYFKPQSLLKFNLSPIPQNARLVFQVYVYKGFLQDKYQLWFCQNQKTSLMLSAISDNLKIQHKTFQIYQPYQLKQEGLFCGQLKSNFKRSSFTLFDDDEIISGPNTKILGSFNAYSSISNKPKLDIYIPTVQKNIVTPIYCNSVAKDLKQISKICQTKHIIEKWFNMSTIPLKQYRKISEQFNLVNSAKNLLLTNGEQFKLYIGKICSKKYKIVAGSGVSPIQLLSIVITHVQN